LTRELDRVEEVLMRHMYKPPICENIVRMNDSLIFEHETRLPDGVWLLIIYRYNFTNELIVDKIFGKKEFDDVTEEYKNHPSVVAVIQLINEEIKNLRALT
jgi:hypothetical protein